MGEKRQMTTIRLSQEFLKDFSKLERRLEKGSGDAEHIIRIINRGMTKLSENPEAGQKIPRKLWPEYYISKYDINNLWRLRLDDSWRMIYTLGKEGIEIFCIVLEAMDHKKYNKRFGYK